MKAGEYAFIFFFSIPGDPTLGDYSWERGDELDMVRSQNLKISADVNKCK